MKVVFMGTPDFAVPSLEKLINDGHDVAAVVTATDKLLGRNKKEVHFSAIKEFAIANDIKVLQPTRLRSEAFLDELKGIDADIFVVVAFRMLPEVVWSMPKEGTINLHASLLPKYRGAAPINWAIVKGETQTGLTTFTIDKKIDTGKILLQQKLDIGPNETAGELYGRMMFLGGELVSETLRGIEDNSLLPQPQNHDMATPAPKIFFDDCHLEPNLSTKQAFDFVRGMSPYPAAWIIWEGKTIKIFRCNYTISKHDHEPGLISIEPKKHFKIFYNDGYIEPTEIQMAGKRKMSVSDFLNGLR